MKQLQLLTILTILSGSVFAQNVGIGTANPQFLLDVRSRAQDVSGIINLSNSDNSSGIRILSGDTANSAKYICWSDGTPLRFAFDGPFKELMRIHSNGFVGIGTEAPTVNLDLRSDNNAAGAVMHIGNRDKTQNIAIFGGDDSNTAKYICWTDQTALRFGFDNSGFQEQMRIDGNGWVGIQTQNPKSELSLAGHFTPDSDLIFDLGHPSYRWRTVYAKEMRVDDMNIIEADLDSALIGRMRVDTLYMTNMINGGVLFNNTNAMVGNSSALKWRADSSYLGVGVSSPSFALDVNGDVHATGNVIIDGYPSFGNRYFLGYYSSSRNLSSTVKGVPINNVVRSDALFSHSLGDTFVVVNEDGFYEITMNVTAYNNTLNSFGVSEWCIRVNNNCLTGSDAAMTHYNNGAGVNGEDNTNIQYIVQLQAGDAIAIGGQKISGTGTIRIESHGCRLFIKKM